jgi:MraZ protein
MPLPHEFILGEHRRTLDERYRVAVPPEFALPLGGNDASCVLVKERPGCLSLWNAAQWQARCEAGVALIHGKLQAGKLEGRLRQVQQLGRLLSTRHKVVQLTGRGRLLIPEGFREFLQAEANSEVMLVGAAICVEIWSPPHWIEHLKGRLPRFGRLFDRLSS